MRRLDAVWGALLALILIVEAWTLSTPAKGDTLSETIWRTVRDHHIGRYVLWGVWSWLTYHFLLQRAYEPRGLSWRDAAVVGLGLVIALGETIYRRGS